MYRIEQHLQCCAIYISNATHILFWVGFQQILHKVWPGHLTSVFDDLNAEDFCQAFIELVQESGTAYRVMTGDESKNQDSVHRSPAGRAFCRPHGPDRQRSGDPREALRFRIL